MSVRIQRLEQRLWWCYHLTHIQTCTHTHTLKKPCFVSRSQELQVSLSLLFSPGTGFVFPTPQLWYTGKCKHMHTDAYTHAQCRRRTCDTLGATEFARWHFKEEWLFKGTDRSQHSWKNTPHDTHTHEHPTCHEIFNTEHELRVHVVNKWGGEPLLAAWITGHRWTFATCKACQDLTTGKTQPQQCEHTYTHTRIHCSH